MRISKITSIQNNKRIANKQVSVENKQNQKNINITNPSLLFQPYIGRDIVSFRAKNYSDTLKENYYQLPIGCSPDAFQIDAGKALNEGKTVLVEAPTGTGKTAIAYYVSTKNMSEGKKTFYTAPLKALSNQNGSTEIMGEICQTITVDSFAKDKKIGCIKFDLEGMETKALRGAEATIKRDKPLLLICLYHTPEDFFGIKPLIESWNLGYKFKIADTEPCNNVIGMHLTLIAYQE